MSENDQVVAPEIEANDDLAESRIYEIGYHVVPIVAEENVGVEVAAIHSLLEKEKGFIISEEFPRLRDLAYAIPKMVGGEKHNFRKAYFGWVKFEAPAEAVAPIQEALKHNEHILRFILIKTVRESTLASIPRQMVSRDNQEKG